MEIDLGTKAPSLVVRTTVPKKKKMPEPEKPGLFDGMWACLLNDYLENSDVSDDNTVDSDGGNSVSTSVVLAKKQMLRRLRKKEKRKSKMKALALRDIDDVSKILSSPDVNNKNARKASIVEIASKQLNREKRVPYPEETMKPETQKPLDVPPEITIDGGSLATSTVTENTIDRLRRERDLTRTTRKRPTLDPEEVRPDSNKSRDAVQPEGHLNDNGIFHSGSQSNPIDIVNTPTERETWNVGEISTSEQGFSRTASISSGRIRSQVQHRHESTPADILDAQMSKSWKNREVLASEQGYHRTTPSSSGRFRDQLPQHPNTKSRTLSGRLPKSTDPSMQGDLDVPVESPVYRKEKRAIKPEIYVREQGVARDSRHDEVVRRDWESSRKDPTTRNSPLEADFREESNFTPATDNQSTDIDDMRQKKLDRREALMRIRAIKARMANLEK